MRRFFQRGDTVIVRLLAAFFLVSVVPIAIAGVLVSRAGEATLREELRQRLGTVTQLRTQQIRSWLDARRQDIVLPSSFHGFRRMVTEVGASRVPSAAVVEELRVVLDQTRISGGFTELFLLSVSEGAVMVSTDREQEGKIKRDQHGPFGQDVHYSTALGRAVLTFSVPVMGTNNAPIAILVGYADLQYIDDLMAERAGLGRTGHTFLVNRESHFVSTSLGSGRDGGRPVFSDGVNRALAGEDGTAVYRNHDGRQVVGAYRTIPEIGLALVAEMDATEAFAPVHRFRTGIIVLFIMVCVAAALIGGRLAWGISRSHTEFLAHSTALKASVVERTRTLTALLEVNQALGSTLDLTETLWCAVRSLVRVLHADAGVAYVLDESGEALRPVSGYQLPPPLRARTGRVSLAVKEHPFIAKACETSEAAFAQDAASDDRLDPALTELWGFRSVLFVPMFSAGRLVGGLFAGWGTTRPPLVQEELSLIDGIGRQAGIAVQNAALFTDSERRRHAAETLAELDAALAGSLDRNVIAAGIVRGARALLKSRVASAYHLDAVSGDFHLLAVDGVAPEDVSPRIPRGAGIVSVAVEQRTVIATPDILADARITLTPELRERMEQLAHPAIMATPLRVADRVVGVLCIADERGRAFTADESGLLRTFASQAALALENARLYDEAQARAARMTRLGEFGRMITSSLNLGEVLERVVGAARELLDADLVRLWVADVPAQTVRLMASQDRTGAAPLGAVTELPLGVGIVGYVMTERRPHYTANLADEPFDADDRLNAAGYTSRLKVPLIVNDRAVGVLTILTKSLRQFGREDAEIVELFASEAGTAVENARLFADTEAQAAVLAKKNAELDAFTYSVSHDLKAPLVTIQAMCGLVMEDQGERLDDDGRRVLRRIEANAVHMATLIGDLLALSKIGREARAPEAVSVGEVVEAVLDRLSEQVRSRGVQVDCAADVSVWGIRVHLEQVFANLISNAIKYLGPTETPRVEIRAEESDAGFVEFSVRDNGIGIDPAYHARVFELFQRLRDVEAEGTGVGLALVKKIVDTAGGRIWVESIQGEGSTFRFTWPVGAAVRTA